MLTAFEITTKHLLEFIGIASVSFRLLKLTRFIFLLWKVSFRHIHDLHSLRIYKAKTVFHRNETSS